MNDESKVQYKLLIPTALKAALEDHAHQNRRSLSQEIIARLQISIEAADDNVGEQRPDYLAELREERARMERLLADYVFLFRTDVGNNLEKLREQVDQIQRQRDTAKRILPRGDTD